MHELKVVLGAADEGEEASMLSQNDLASPVGEEERAQNVKEYLGAEDC